MEVFDRTINYSLSVLNNQLLNCHERPKDKEQRAYYQGMREMLEIICTQGFENLSFCVMQKANGKHYIPAMMEADK